jgi:hypothetical protein
MSSSRKHKQEQKRRKARKNRLKKIRQPLSNIPDVKVISTPPGMEKMSDVLVRTAY